MAKKSNADYCREYKQREAVKAAALDIAPVSFNLSRGDRDNLAAAKLATGMGSDELISVLLRAATVGTFSIPSSIAADDPIFRHLEQSNNNEAIKQARSELAERSAARAGAGRKSGAGGRV